MQSSAFPLVLMEAGFKIIQGKESEFFGVQNRMVPVGMKQPGFLAVYGGGIADSQWLYFSVRFASPEQMDAWHQDRGHRAVQKQAYEKWWTAMYIRKWQRPRNEVQEGRLLVETRIERDEPLSGVEMKALKVELSTLSEFHVGQFETLTGQYEPQPYQLVGPLEIAPSPEGVSYALMTHWQSSRDIGGWLESPSYKRLSELGRLSSETFVPYAEGGARDFLRQDNLQRDWKRPTRDPHVPAAMTSESKARPPDVSERFIDEQGVHWLVQAVTNSDIVQGFYIIRVAFGPTVACDHDVWVLGRREWEALVRERRLEPANDEGRPL